MLKAFLINYAEGKCQSIQAYDDAKSARTEYDRVNARGDRAKLLYASDESDLDVKLGDAYSENDDLDLLDQLK